jgi:uncharacterized protein (DUF427 family)
MRKPKLVKATLKGKSLAESGDVITVSGYLYFPRAHVRLDRLEKADKTPADHACPHGVQFYHVLLDGTRHERAAWIYENPQGDLKPVANRVGFWKDVEIG